MLQRAENALREVFGFHQFRDQQQAIVEHLLDDGDALVVMATGAGKSLCYQLPALVREGVGIVVSPLVSLMQQQVSDLEQNGVNAACLHSALDWQEQQEIEQQLQAGALDLLYLSPERLLNETTLRLLHRVDIALFAIDEAHCIWRWGTDFRPDYQMLSVLPEQFPRVPRIALTATASVACRQSIKAELNLGAARVFEGSVDRPNLFYWVQPRKNARKQLVEFIRARHSGDCGIVYCQTRRAVEQAADFLCEQKINAAAYHAGLEREQRSDLQCCFLAGKIQVIVATVAFGMGIDKPDVRFVAHLDLPRSLEAYYQELGRAGRDGLPADAWMVFGLRDFQLQQQWIRAADSSDARKQWDRQQSCLLLDYALTADCRRQRLLDFFGETIDEPCGHCDNCKQAVETRDITLVARQALSAVFRTGERYGLEYIIKVLRGKTSAQTASRGHESLRLFGIGHQHSADFWRAVLQKLIAESLLRVHGEYCELLRLSADARPLLEGEVSLWGAVPAKAQARHYAPIVVEGPELDQALVEQLRQTRMRLSRQHGLLPFQVFNNRSLLDLVQKLPLSPQALHAIDGFGQHRVKTFGEVILSEISIYCTAQQQQLDALLHCVHNHDEASVQTYCLDQDMSVQSFAQRVERWLDQGMVAAAGLIPLSPQRIEQEYLHWPSVGTRQQRVAQGYARSADIPRYWLACLDAARGIDSPTQAAEVTSVH